MSLFAALSQCGALDRASRSGYRARCYAEKRRARAGGERRRKSLHSAPRAGGRRGRAVMFLPLYIDPGTGSAMFSIVIGAAAALYFLLRTAFLAAKTAALGGRARNAAKHFSPFVFYCEGPQYCAVFQPVLAEFEKRGIAALYLTSARNDPALAGEGEPDVRRSVKREYIGEGNKAFARLNFLSAGIVLATTPGLGVYQWKRSKTVRHYCHILHDAAHLHKYELYGTDFYDSILLSGDYERDIFTRLAALRGFKPQELVTVGCSYLDVYAEKIKALPPRRGGNTVLVSPTWGAPGLLAKCGVRLLDALAQTPWNIIVRPHPQSRKAEPELLESLQKRYAACRRISWDFERENICALSKADVMISDISGIIFDFMFLFDKPVLYLNENIDLYPYDAWDIREGHWYFKTLAASCAELKEEMFADIDAALRSAVQSDALREARRRAKDEAWQYRGEAGKRITDFLLATYQSLEGAR